MDIVALSRAREKIIMRNQSLKWFEKLSKEDKLNFVYQKLLEVEDELREIKK